MSILDNGLLLATLDTFGWFVIFFVGLLFGIPYTRYFLRVKSIPTWPTTAATVTLAAAGHDSVFSFGYGLHYCSVCYGLQVDSTVCKGGFYLMAGDEAIASSVATQLMNTKIQVRYNPKRPTDSLPVEKEILGRKVFQQQSWLNPNAW
jgi:hypothetical protein